MEIKFKKDMSVMDELFNFIDQFAGRNRLDSDICFALNLAAEEIFTNLVKYSTQSRNDIHITLDQKEDQIILTLTDFDVDPFDINQFKSYDIHQPLQKRPIGKLGIHIVKKLMDQVTYHYENRTSTITLVKEIRKVYV